MREAEKNIDTLHRVELPEGVEIELRVCGPLARASAWLIDFLIRIAFYFILTIGLSLLERIGIPEGYISGTMMIIVFTTEWFYFVIFEAGPKAATPGKRAMHLQVTTTIGGPISFSQAMIRNFLRFVDFMPFAYLIGFLTCLFSRSSQRLGDLAAGTVVCHRHMTVITNKPKGVEPKAPGIPLERREQEALSAFADRVGALSKERRVELASILTGLTGERGIENYRQVQRIAAWLDREAES